MRELTKEEINGAPRWSDRYIILADELYFVNESHQSRFSDGFARHTRDLFFDYSKCKKMPKYDIENYTPRWADSFSIDSDGDILVSISNMDGEITLDRGDIIALAKTVRLTSEDL